MKLSFFLYSNYSLRIKDACNINRNIFNMKTAPNMDISSIFHWARTNNKEYLNYKTQKSYIFLVMYVQELVTAVSLWTMSERKFHKLGSTNRKLPDLHSKKIGTLLIIINKLKKK
jgi:hypothetical protein